MLGKKKDQSEETYGHLPQLIVEANKNSAGLYFCEAKVLAYPAAISRSAGLTLLAKPEINSDKIQFGELGEEAVLRCDTTNGDVESAIWKRNGVKIPEEDTEIEAYNNRLVIKRVAEKHFIPMYSCTVLNKLGEDSLSISLKIKTPISSSITPGLVLYLLVGCLSFLVLLMTGCLLYLLYIRRKNSNRKYMSKELRLGAEIDQQQAIQTVQPDLLPDNVNDLDTRRSSTDTTDNCFTEKEKNKIETEGSDRRLIHQTESILYNLPPVTFHNIRQSKPFILGDVFEHVPEDRTTSTAYSIDFDEKLLAEKVKAIQELGDEQEYITLLKKV